VIKVPAVKRSVRVGELLLKEIADLIEHRVRDPRVGRVTLTGVSMSNDLKSAKVFFSLLGDSDEIVKATKGLESAKGFIKREIGRRLELRYMPEIEFRYDPSLERGEEMEKLFKSLKSSENKED
jgi:ribosome-binding factor A